ncbi:methyl-galactoside ABC transporter ATPase [Gammaproteobacteria bacterium]|nr:methyl-galactoside ABC transporter ATPase [Gammaproteobacteria bacterium]
MSDYILEIENLSKTFPGVKALDNISFKVKTHSVHALMGENGAGKSTLMKCLSGIYQPDDGSKITLNGQSIHIQTPLDALHLGIAMIHQELNLIPEMTIAENIWLGREPLIGFFVDHRQLNQITTQLLKKINLDLPPTTLVGNVSIAHQQMIEIAKAISYDAQVVIMDEPTSALTDKEVIQLFILIRELKEQGKTIIYISHKMDEIFEITDEISVFRDGCFVGSDLTENLSKDQLITMMVGRPLTQFFPKFNTKIGEDLLVVKNLSRHNSSHTNTGGSFSDVSFNIRKGEILGVAGLVGSGRTEIAEALFGVHPAQSGSISIDGQEISMNTPAIAIKQGLAFLTEDRKKSGLFLVLSVLDNMCLVNMDDYIKSGFISHKKMYQDCDKQINTLRIKTPNQAQIIANLSGGNQQKVLLARWLLTAPKILILDEPTRGIDVGAKAEIYKLMSNLANKGVAILMISSELPEILGMSDRIMVMREGKVSGILDRDEADQTKILSLAAN